MGRTKQMDVRDSLRGVRATDLKSTKGQGTPSITRKKETSGMSNLPVNTIGRDPNIQYNIEHVFYDKGKEVSKMPVMIDNNTVWCDLTRDENGLLFVDLSLTPRGRNGVTLYPI